MYVWLNTEQFLNPFPNYKHERESRWVIMPLARCSIRKDKPSQSKRLHANHFLISFCDWLPS